MRRIVDLTLPIATAMAGIPGLNLYSQYPTRLQAVTVVDEEQRKALIAEKVDVASGAPAIGSMNTIVHLNTHVGTHIDAPRHFFSAGSAVDQLPLDRLVMRDAVIIDVSHKTAGEGVSGHDLEKTGVRPKAGEIAVIKTSWTERAWNSDEFWGKPVHLEPSVSEWLESFDIASVAMDCFPEKPFWLQTLTPAERGANHKRWLKAGIPMIQMLIGLSQIGPRFKLTALPLRLPGIDGSPARVVGIED